MIIFWLGLLQNKIAKYLVYKFKQFLYYHLSFSLTAGSNKDDANLYTAQNENMLLQFTQASTA